MSDPKPGEPFGLDSSLLSQIDWKLSLSRVTHDLRSDFVYAPHLAYIYHRAGDRLIAELQKQLKDGKFAPGLPVTIEVPKSYRVKVNVQSKRLGPSFSRPGSILLPLDRMLYQALADHAAPIIESKLDHKRSFSHKLAPGNTASMFVPTRTCWNDLQKALKAHSKDKSLKYVVKIDVANFFGSLNQHILMNTLNGAGYPKSLSSRLELMLTGFVGERNSRGIIQGIFPSDLFGNFYLMPVDRFLDEQGFVSARYVDDVYIFVESVDRATILLRELIPFLRSYDVVLNEAKCVIMPKLSLITEEPDLEELFNDAVEEISEQIDDDEFDADYGFQAEWDESEDEQNNEEKNEVDEDLKLKATEVLFDSIEKYPGQEENIERFCLPLFAKAESDYAVPDVMDAFKKRPAMSQIYSSYLAKFLPGDQEISDFFVELLNDDLLADWQKMWVLAALLQVKPADDAPVKAASKLLKDANRHDALRAVAAIFIGRYGDFDRRKAVRTIYPSVSAYVQAAIYYSSRFWKGVEKTNAKADWGSHGFLNTLISVAHSEKSAAATKS